VADPLVTKQFSYHAAKAFANSFLADSVYFYAGKPDKWGETESVEHDPHAANDVHLNHISIWNAMAGAVRITRNDVAVGVHRFDWEVDTIYDKYTDTMSSSYGSGANGYYVMAGPSGIFGINHIYKCLDNNGNAYSTSMPVHTDVVAKREPDGYIWKYMYTVKLVDRLSFVTTNVIPVATDTGGIMSAGPGTILNIPLPANNLVGIGEKYRGTGYSNGTLGVSLDTLDATANIKTAVTTACNKLQFQAEGGIGEADFYNNCSIMITSGSSKNKIYDITDYDGTNLLTITPNANKIAVGDTFKIGPKITVIGDGSGLKAIGNVNGYGNVVSIDVGSIGSGYSNVSSVTIEGIYDGDNGTDAYANVYIPPFSGHGFNPASELRARYAIINPKLPIAGSSVDGDGYFVGIDSEYRQAGLLRNPLTIDNARAKGTSYDLRTHLYFNSQDVSYSDIPTYFPANTIVTNSNTGATAMVWNHPDTGAGSRHITLVNVVSNNGLTFSNGQYIIGTGGVGVVSSANLDQFLYKGIYPISPSLPGQLAKYSGDIVYHENQKVTYRTEGSSSDIKLVFEF